MKTKRKDIKLDQWEAVFAMVWPYYYGANIVDVLFDLQLTETYQAYDLEGIVDSVVYYVTQHLVITPFFFFNERGPSML